MDIKSKILLLALLIFSLKNFAQQQPIPATYKIGDVISSISFKTEKQAIVTFPTINLNKSKEQGWEYIEDLHSRNTTTLFFQLKTDKSNAITDSDNKRYFKTLIRFGFKDEANGYQLPGSFYIQEFQSKILSFGEEGLSHKNPCIMFADAAFYIFIPNFIGLDKQEAILFTFNAANGLNKQVLWKDKIKESSALAYFREDEKQRFALEHISYSNNNALTTQLVNNNFVTRVTQLKVYQPILENNYREQIQPYFLPLKPEPFKKITIASKTYIPICDLSVFLNTPKDRALYNRLSQLPSESLSKLEQKDHHKYKGLFFQTDSLNATRIYYDEVAHTCNLIPNMPATKDQDPFPSCISYAYGALYAQWINSDWQLKAMREIEPDALKYETDISYFGMQQYLRGNKVGVDADNLWRYSKTLQEELRQKQGEKPAEFDFEFNEGEKFYIPFEIILQNENQLDAIPTNVRSYYYQKYGTTYPEIDGKKIEIGDLFRTHLQSLYEQHHTDNKPNSLYKNEISEISTITGIPIKNIDLQKAFAQPSFQAFMYQLFFGKSKDFIAVAYRNNLVTQQFSDTNAMKQEIVKLLQKGSAVLAHIYSAPNYSTMSHTIVICGFKKLINPITGEKIDAFKIHNSWGNVWDEQTNGGWFLADHFLSYVSDKEITYINSDVGTKPLKNEWLENTDDYQRIYKGAYTQQILNIKTKYIGSAKSNNQMDAAALLLIMKNEKLKFTEFVGLIKPFFAKLGYAFRRENLKDEEIEFDGVTLAYDNVSSGRYIICPTKNLLNQLKLKLDFSKINGQFIESAFSDGGNYLKVRQDYD